MSMGSKQIRSIDVANSHTDHASDDATSDDATNSYSQPESDIDSSDPTTQELADESSFDCSYEPDEEALEETLDDETGDYESPLYETSLAEATEVMMSDPRANNVQEVESQMIESTASEVSTEIELDDPRAVALSEPFVERWSVLISTTNWEKGSIICAWRSELESQSAPSTAYSDEAWSRRVGGVTSQHVGRLRRVYQRFGNSHTTYQKLYWTHFLAALDWDDAEMWLEGASQSAWSVSQMRATRWQAMGGDPAEQPTDGQIVNVSLDEDYSPTPTALKTADDQREDAADKSRDIAEGPRFDGPDFGDEDPTGAVATADNSNSDGQTDDWDDVVTAEPLASPFASLPVLPVDVADALEQFKLAIIRHRASQWTDIKQPEMLAVIEALRMFTQQ